MLSIAVVAMNVFDESLIPSIVGGEDYEDNSPYTVTFNSGSMSAILQIPIIADSIVESSEVFEADLTIPRESFDKGIRAQSPNVSMVTIMDTNGGTCVCQMYSVCVVKGPASESLVWRVAWFS